MILGYSGESDRIGEMLEDEEEEEEEDEEEEEEEEEGFEVKASVSGEA